MMRLAERYLEKKRKKKGGSKWEKLREWEKKRNCPFDAKKVCPVTITISKHSLASHFEQFCAASSIFRWGCLFYVLTPENYPPIRPDFVFSILHNTSVHSVVTPFLSVKSPPFGVLFAVLRRK